VDLYFVVLERLGNQVDRLEAALLERPETDLLQAIQQVRREVLFIRQTAWPLREVVNHLHREASPLVAQETRLYLRAIYDHLVQMIDTIEISREIVVGLLDLHLFNLNNRMNEVMKILALFTSIFILLTFIAGVYGMNFHHLPRARPALGLPGPVGGDDRRRGGHGAVFPQEEMVVGAGFKPAPIWR